MHSTTGNCDLTRLTILRKSKKVAQIDVALAIGMNQNSYSKYETGKSKPPLKKLILLSNYYDVSVDYLLNRTDIKKKYPKKKGLLKN